MGAPTLSAMPTTLIAGDSVSLTISLPDYPAGGGWVATAYLRGKNGTKVDWASTASGDDHAFTATAAATAAYTPGEYAWVLRVTKGADTVTVANGLLTVQPDLSAQADNYDHRSLAQRCLDNLNAVLEGKATRDVLNSTIAGQSLSRMSWDEILAARARFMDEVRAEQAALNAANGRSTGNHVLIRFGAP